MISTVTLVHKGAMPIAVHAISSFGRHFSAGHKLDIHTDGSPDEEDERLLLSAAGAMEARIVRPEDRRQMLECQLASYPKTRALLDGVGYNAKLELPMVLSPPYFYFDSDIVWLRPAVNLLPSNASNAFSTESWTWYNGVSNDAEWIKAKTPRRVNSGFYYLTEEFPFQQMEEMLERRMFDSEARYNTDQEIMAYLYRNMEMYHPEDLKRTRRGHIYDLATDPSVAIHFPGGMWHSHLDQMGALEAHSGREPVAIRRQPAYPLTRLELLDMRMKVRISDSALLGKGINLLRSLLRRHS